MKIFLIVSLPFLLFANECITCHKGMNKSHALSHYTLSDTINITRKAWGIKGSNETLETLPQAKIDIIKPEDLVDDLLRRKCLACHLTSKTINRSKNSCLACHDRHSDKTDSFKAHANQKKCIHCHHGENIGTDYLGLFPHDYDKSYRSPLDKQGYYPKRYYGIDYHHLQSDIHHQKKMQCVDCHTSKNNQRWEKPSCKNCHINLSAKNHKNYHQKISCSACHSSWNMSSYELHLLRDDTKNYKQWDRLHVQEDMYLENFLNKAKKSKIKPNPMMPDYLENKLKSGIWYQGWKYRRWENFFLVNSDDGTIKIAKPMFQYHVSYKNKDGDIVFDDISMNKGEKMEAFVPTTPHTISKKAKSCERCHENKIMLDNTLIQKELFQGKIYKGSPLSKEQLHKLQSYKYKKERAKILFETIK